MSRLAWRAAFCASSGVAPPSGCFHVMFCRRKCAPAEALRSRGRAFQHRTKLIAEQVAVVGRIHAVRAEKEELIATRFPLRFRLRVQVRT